VLSLDNTDLKLLTILATNGRISQSELAAQVGLTNTPCIARLRKLETAGVISGYTANIDSRKICEHAQILMAVKLESHTMDDFKAFESEVMQRTAVQDCWAVGGGLDYIMRVCARSVADYQAWIDILLDKDIRLERYHTYVITKQIKGGSFANFTQAMGLLN
jgi:Lrp/AsnC family transcriptional regulator of ectoine degradation